MSKMKPKMDYSQRGVTLIEVVLYIALFALMFFSVVQFMMAVSEKNQVAKGRNKIETGLIAVTQHLENSFAQADSVDDANCVFESNPGVLRLNTASGVIEYSVSGQKLLYDESGVSFDLTESEIAVTEFYLQEVLDKSSQVTGVRLTLTLQFPKEGTSETIVTSFIL